MDDSIRYFSCFFWDYPRFNRSVSSLRNYAESFFPWVSTWRFIEFRTNFQTPRNGNHSKSKMFTPKVGFFYHYCFLNVFSSWEIGAGWEPKMKLIFSNSSGFALVQKKHLGKWPIDSLPGDSLQWDLDWLVTSRGLCLVWNWLRMKIWKSNLLKTFYVG